jgi:hypothetical protein
LRSGKDEYLVANLTSTDGFRRPKGFTDAPDDRWTQWFKDPSCSGVNTDYTIAVLCSRTPNY